MKQFRLRKTLRLAKQMLLYEFSQLLGMNERFDSGQEWGEMIVKVRDMVLLTVEDIKGLRRSTT